MPTFYPEISDNLAEWCQQQAVFFTASAPLHGRHINVSPKGLTSATFKVFGPNSVGYVDATGSGCETISHVNENGRVTLMFCSFERSPRILRMFCRGRVVEHDSAEFEPLMAKMHTRLPGARAVILFDVFLVQTSCGFGVPLLTEQGAQERAIPEDKAERERLRREAEGTDSTSTSQDTQDTQDKEPAEKLHHYHGFQDRDTIGAWASKMLKKDALDEYRREKNSRSLDGLPGVKSAMRTNGDWLWLVGLGARLRRVPAQKHGFVAGFLAAVLLYLALVSALYLQQLGQIPVLVSPAVFPKFHL